MSKERTQPKSRRKNQEPLHQDMTVRGRIRLALTDAVLQMLDHESGAWQFVIEDVHQMRTAVRRLRSLLRFYRPILRRSCIDSLLTELKWLADVLGGLRDLDVMEERLRRSADSIGAGLAALPVFEGLKRRRDQCRRHVGESLGSRRFRALRHQVIQLCRSPEWSDQKDPLADRFFMRRLTRLRQRVRAESGAITEESPTEDLHRLRRQAKRLRYAAEAHSKATSREDDSRRVMRIINRATQCQQLLGRFQDATIATEYLDTIVSELGPNAPARPTIEQMICEQRAEASIARSRFLKRQASL